MNSGSSSSVPFTAIPPGDLNAPPDPDRKNRLIERVRRAMAEQRFSPRTRRAYAQWIKRYVVFHRYRHPADLDAEAVRRFLSDLAVRQRVSVGTQNQAMAALVFLYGGVGCGWKSAYRLG